MDSNFRATYHLPNSHFYAATIFVSTVTITIRYKDESGEQHDVYWLGDNVISFDRNQFDAVLLYKNASGQTEKLVIRDQALTDAILKNFRHKKFTGGYGHIAASGKSKLLIVLGSILAIIVLAYVLLVPWIAEKIAMNFSKEKEIAIGEQMYSSIVAEYKVDEKKSAILNQFYNRLGYKTSYPIKITVIKSDQVNAFAIPGGHLVVYDAILDGMKTPEELAALLGHEASHVELRHSLRNISRSLARKIFIVMIFGTDAGLAGYLADNADDLKGLQYSRSLETEADNNGLRMMSANGINTEGMLRLMNLLKQETRGPEPVGFLSTHPIFKDRIDNIRKQIATLQNNTTNHDRLKQLFHDLY